MKKMKNFMVVHRDPDISWDKVEENWSRMLDFEQATWLRTYYNKERGFRLCLWLAPNEEELKKIFTDLQNSWESIMEVEETIPDIWAKKH
jgi:hypothetical protein